MATGKGLPYNFLYVRDSFHTTNAQGIIMKPIEVQVSYYTNKAGTYVEFRMDCSTRSLSEMNSWNDYLMKSIRQNFKELFKEYGMDFSSDSAYVVPCGEQAKMVVCLFRDDHDEALIRHLREIGIGEGE